MAEQNGLVAGAHQAMRHAAQHPFAQAQVTEGAGHDQVRAEAPGRPDQGLTHLFVALIDGLDLGCHAVADRNPRR